MTNAVQWVRATGSGDSDRQIAARSGIPAGTLGRQLANDMLTPENIVAVARAYKVSPIEGLIALNLIRTSDVERMSAREALTAASDEDLAEEILRRLQAVSGEHEALTQPLAPVTSLRPIGAVSASIDYVHPDADVRVDFAAADDAPDWELEDAGREEQP